MKQRILLIASAVLVFGALFTSSRAYAGNHKKKVTTQQNLKYFKRIVMSTPYDVHFVQGESNTVKLVGPQAEVSSVVLRVSGETLYIERAAKRSRMFFTSSDDVDIYITSPDLTQLEIKGSGDFKAARRVDTDQLTVSINGSGDIDFKDIICDKLVASINGSGDIEFGFVECVNAEATSTSNALKPINCSSPLRVPVTSRPTLTMLETLIVRCLALEQLSWQVWPRT